MPSPSAQSLLPTSATHLLVAAAALFSLAGTGVAAEPAPPVTEDGRFSIATIRATVVYFVPADRDPLPDWRERIEWLCDRLRRFHRREFAGTSRLVTAVHPEPFRSAFSTAAVRAGDGDASFFRTLREVDAAIDPTRDADGAFPVLLVLSDVNWRPLDDFSRMAPAAEGWRFEGSLSPEGIHVPGAAAGGSRAIYLPDRGRGWGLVSGDGWRVPCRGSDCVAYHEGIGHAIGLPHPDAADGSVMSEGQYRHALAQSWLDPAQKEKLRFAAPPDAPPADPVFDHFTVTPEPAAPRPRERVFLRLEPHDILPEGLRVEIQTGLRAPWMTIPVDAAALREGRVALGSFDRPGGVAWRVRGDAPAGGGDDGPSAATAWGYFQVRTEPGVAPPPAEVDAVDRESVGVPATLAAPGDPSSTIDLLALADPTRDKVAGDWERGDRDGRVELIAPKAFGARLELPYAPPEAYRLTVIAEPLDEPHGLTLGLRSGNSRFLALLGFGDASPRASALENVDGANVATNPTRVEGDVFVRGRPAEIVCTVEPGRVRVTVDGRSWIDWRGSADRLSLGDYWRTPREEALFLGAYDCRYRFTRVSLEPLSGTGRALEHADGSPEH